MQQLYFDGPRVLVWREAAEPRIQQPTDALVRPLAVAVCDADAAAIRGQAEREPARPNTLAYTPKVIDLLAHRKLPMRAIHSVIPWSDAAEALVEPSHKTVVARTVAASADHTSRATTIG